MDSTTPAQTPAGAAAMMGPITTVHLIIIAILMVLTIAMIVFGMRLKAKRKAAEAETQEHREAVEAHGGVTADAPAVEAPIARPVVAPTPVPAPVSVVAPVPQTLPEPSDLTRLKGLGPKLAAQLAERGMTRIEQIAALSPTEAAALDGDLGSFSGRLSRDRWVEQAQLLAAGDTAGYQAQFGKL